MTINKIKVCGITDLSIANFCIENGADYLGFVSYSDSPRDISFRGNLTLVDRSGSGEAVLKQENLLKLVNITDGDVISNKAIICNSDKNISGVNNQRTR